MTSIFVCSQIKSGLIVYYVRYILLYGYISVKLYDTGANESREFLDTTDYDTALRYLWLLEFKNCLHFIYLIYIIAMFVLKPTINYLTSSFLLI